MNDAQFQARDMFEQHQFADGVKIKIPAVSPKLSATPGKTRWLGPELGEHTEQVLSALGYTEAQIHAFKEQQII